jgi:hypothetical protein
VSQEADEPRIYKNPRNSPSSLCPRDEEQADLYVNKSSRKAIYLIKQTEQLLLSHPEPKMSPQVLIRRGLQEQKEEVPLRWRLRNVLHKTRQRV